MKNFENELLLMVKNIEFKNVKNKFHEKLKEDINEIKTYKKSNKTKISNINFTAKKITEKLSIERMEESEAYITKKETQG